MKTPRVAFLLTVLLASACAVGPNQSSSSTPAQGSRRVLPIDAADLSDLTWLPSGWLVVGYNPTPSKPGRNIEVWRLRPDGSEFARIPMPSDSTCWQTEYLFPSALDDGR